jgi:class 3 adenylate cyclase/predicted ATPase
LTYLRLAAAARRTVPDFRTLCSALRTFLPYNLAMAAQPDVNVLDPIGALLGDLDTIARVAQSGVQPATTARLEPGETRPAAIVFVDVVGFTNLAQVLDSETLTKLIDRTFQIFDHTVKGHGGYCDKVIGDAGLYVFAGHIAYEPPCQAALRCALALQGRAAQINQSLAGTELSLGVRCGVSFGMVTRQRVGGPAAQVTVMGATVNLAQRLEGAAQPGTVYTVREVLDEVGELFDVESAGTAELKGFGPREVFRVTAERRREVRLRGRGQISPLVGRDELLDEAEAIVEGWWREADEAAARGEKTPGRLLVFQGPTAIGKSRVAWELVKRLKAKHNIATATAHCTPHGGLLAFAAELLQVADLRAEGLVDRWTELCPRGADVHGADYAERAMQHLPLLAYLLGSSEVDTSGIRQADNSSFLLACKLALKTCCELLEDSAQNPRSSPELVLVIEDLQWSGEQQLELCSYLLDELGLPPTVIATCRDELRNEHASTLLERGAVHRLEALSDEQGRALFQALLPGLKLPEKLDRQLHRNSAGLPYYFEETALLLQQRGIVESTGPDSPEPHYRLTGDTSQLELPHDLRMLILGRLDLLDPKLRAVAQHASVIGRSFAVPELQALQAAVDGPTGTHLKEALAHLLVEGLLILADDGRYMFRHILTRRACYDSLLTSNKHKLHNAYASLLRGRFAPGSADETYMLRQIALHYYRAVNSDEAIEYMCELLIAMAKSHNLRNWKQIYSKAKELAIQSDPNQWHYIYRARGVYHLTKNKLTDAECNFKRATKLAQEFNDLKSVSRALIDLAIVIRLKGDINYALELQLQALHLLKQLNSSELLSLLYSNMGLNYHSLGKHEKAKLCYEQALIQSSISNDIRSRATTLINLGSLQIELGDVQTAISSFTYALEAATCLHDLALQNAINGNLGVAYYHDGQASNAINCFQQSLQLSLESNLFSSAAFCALNLAELYEERNSFDQSIHFYQVSANLFEQCGNLPMYSVALSQQGRVYARHDKRDLSYEALTKALKLCNFGNDLTAIGVNACCWAVLAKVNSDSDSYNTWLDTAKLCSERLNVGSNSPLNLALQDLAGK